MQDIEQRLLSRFKWGLSAELQVPDLETRISILKNKLFRDGVTINENIIEALSGSSVLLNYQLNGYALMQ